MTSRCPASACLIDVLCDALPPPQVLGQLLVVFLHFGTNLLTLGPQPRGGWRKYQYPVGLLLTTLACCYCLFVRVIVRGTFAHLVMGMMGVEAAFRIVRDGVLFTARSKAEFFLMFAMFVPNLMGVLESTLVAVKQDPIRLLWKPADEWAKSTFYDKQHAILHGALCVLVLSVWSSYWDRWRRSARMQQARVFIEPSCLVAVASILFTHHHGLTMPWEGEGFATHPVMGVLMCLDAIFHMMTAAAHLAHPNPDLCSPLPGGGPPALRMSRLVCAFFYLLLGFFLFIDTHMEYMGCRQVVILVGGPGVGPRLGHSAGSEISSYLSGTFMLAALALSLMIARMPFESEGGGAKVYVQVGSCPTSKNGYAAKNGLNGEAYEGHGLLSEGASDRDLVALGSGDEGRV